MAKFLISLVMAGVAAMWFLGEPAANDPAKSKPISDIERELKEMSQTISALQAKSQKAGAQSRSEIDRATKTLQDRIHATQKHLTDLQNNPSTSALRDRVARALHKIKDWLSKKRSSQ